MLLAAAAARAEEPVDLTANEGMQVVGPHMSLLADPAGTWSLEQVTAPERAELFVASPASRPSLGYSKAAYWIRFQVLNPTSAALDWVLRLDYELLEDVRLFVPLADGGHREIRAGCLQPLGPDLLPDRAIAFALREASGTHTYFLRVHTSSPINLPLTALSPEAYERQITLELIFLWMFYGLMAGLLLYNLMLFFGSRDRSYLYYAGSLAFGSAFLFIHNGLGYRHLWPGAGIDSNQALLAAGFGWMGFMSLFSRSFLDLDRRAPWLGRFFRGLAWFCMAGVLVGSLHYFEYLHPIGSAIVSVISLVYLIGGWWLWRRGLRVARYYALACTALMLGIFVGLLNAVGLAPIHFVTVWGYQIGFALEAILLSLALADRIQDMKREVEGLNQDLESRVQARTQMLETTTRAMEARTEELEVINQLLEEEIRERARAEDERNLLQEQLRQSQKLDALGQLAGGVAHDMNNVLGAISGFATLLRDELSATDPRTADLDEILIAARRGAELTRNLLGFSRKAAFENKTLQLNEVVRQVERLLDRTLLKQANIELDLAFDLASVQGDAGQLSHAVMNLCLNSLDAMDGGGHLLLRTSNLALDAVEAGKVELAPGDYVRLEVIDQGCGMPGEILARACEPFFTTKPRGRGTGLGLSLTYGTVRHHGGSLRLESQVGQGTRVAILLPAAARVQQVDGPDQDLARLGPLSGTVLVIDDEEMIRKVAARMLQAAGLEVMQAASGAEAIGLVREHGPALSLVLLDMVMPVLDGRATFHELRKRSPRLPILICSGYSEQSTIDDLLAKGAMGLVRKPFERLDLVRTVASCLARVASVGEPAA
jgi:signal transduction histidine kinase/ActR/RegA family two-component response regulator